MSPLNDHHHHLKKKRVGKACDSCRIKKTKCDGKKPCNRCLQDNKICVFTEKKKPKEKTHLSGYVELLETRLDLLTKSLEKLVLLTKDHVPFLNDLVLEGQQAQSPYSDDDDEEDDDIPRLESVPINHIVTYLINQQGLLNNVPLEWENGAMIAANMPTTKRAIVAASQKFADHKLRKDEEEAFSSPDSKQSYEHKELNSPTKLDELSSPSLVANREDSWTSPQPAIEENLNFSLGYTDLTSTTKNDLTDLESDCSVYSHALADFPKKANSLFISKANSFDSSGRNSSVSSLTNKLENHDLHSPVSLTPQTSGMKRSTSLSSSAPKWTKNGHIHKPHKVSQQGHGHNPFHVSTDLNLISSRLSDSLPKVAPVPDTLANSIFDDNLLFNSPPSDAFRGTGLNIADLDIMDTNNIDSIAETNPFLMR